MKVTGLTKVNYKGETGLTLKGYAEKKAAEFKLAGEDGVKFVMTAISAAFKEDYEHPEDMPDKTKKNLDKVIPKVKADLEASDTERRKAKEALEKEKAAADAAAAKKKDEAAKAVAKWTPSLEEKVEKVTEGVLANATTMLGKAFTIKDGHVVANKAAGKITAEEYGQAFTALNQTIKMSEALGKGFAKLEAELAIIAEEGYGPEWPNFFSADPARIATIKKNIACLKTAKAIGFDFTLDQGEVGIAVARSFLEAKIVPGKDPESVAKNLEFKKEVAEAYVAKAEELGKIPSADEARILVNSMKDAATGNTESKKYYSHLYLFADSKGQTQWIGSFGKEPDQNLLAKCVACVNKSLCEVKIVQEGGKDKVIAVAIEPPSDSVKKWLLKNCEVDLDKKPEEVKTEPVAATKGKDKPAAAAKPAKGKPAPVVEEEEELVLAEPDENEVEEATEEEEEVSLDVEDEATEEEIVLSDD